MMRLSSTVSSESRLSSCGTTPSRARMLEPSTAGSMPRMRSSPLVGFDTQPIMRIVDVLPAPFGPRKPNASPGSTWKSMPSTATKLPKRFDDVGTPDEGLGARNRHERRRYRFPGTRFRGLPASVRGLRPRERRELAPLPEAVHADEAEITQPRELHVGRRRPVRAIDGPDAHGPTSSTARRSGRSRRRTILLTARGTPAPTPRRRRWRRRDPPPSGRRPRAG